MSESAQTSPSETIEVTYSASDIAALNVLIWSYWATLIGIISALLIAVPLIFGIMDGYPIGDLTSAIDWSFTGWVLLALIAWLLLVIGLRYWWQRRQGLLGPIHFALTEDGVSFRNRQMNGLIFWDTIRSIKTRGGRAFLFITKRSALIFPRRSFADDAAFARWIDATQRHVGQTHGTEV